MVSSRAFNACRYLLRIEDGYAHHPYHCRIHAADVLRTYHTLLTRGGVLHALVASARLKVQHDEEKQRLGAPQPCQQQEQEHQLVTDADTSVS